VIGPLLAAPPERGDLPEQVQGLADREWRHPITGQWVQFGLSIIERRFDSARNEKKLESIRAPIEERRSGKLFPKAIRDFFINVDNFSFFQVILHSGI